MGAFARTQFDHGYAWVVLGACIVIRGLVDGVWATLGIMMLQWQDHFNISASQTAWIGSSLFLLIFSTAPISSALAHRFTYRLVTIGGGILAFTCLFALSFVTSLWQIYVIMPILGITLGLIYQPGCTFFVHYFDKHYALANSLNSAATGLGVLIFPPSMELLISAFGWQGTSQILSAIMANVCVCGLLLRPSQFEKASINSNSKESKTVDSKDTSSRSLLKDIAKDFDLSLFTNIQFVLQGIINPFLFGGILATLIYLVPYATKAGIDALNASFIMSVVGMCRVIASLSPVGFLVDKKILSTSKTRGISFIIIGLTTILIPFLKSFPWLVAVAVVYGLMWGIAGSLLMVIIACSASCKEKATGAQAWALQQMGLGGFVSIVGIGWLYNKLGSYQVPLIILGILSLCMGIIAIADPLLHRWQLSIEQKRKNRKSSTCAYVYSSLEV